MRLVCVECGRTVQSPMCVRVTHCNGMSGMQAGTKVHLAVGQSGGRALVPLLLSADVDDTSSPVSQLRGSRTVSDVTLIGQRILTDNIIVFFNTFFDEQNII